MAFTDSIALFLRDFGEVVTLHPGESGETTATAVFTEDYYQDPAGMVDISSTQPYLEGDPDDLAALAPGDAITADGRSFKVARPPVTVAGVTRIYLNEVIV